MAVRAWFLLCLRLGKWLRSARYSKVEIVERDGTRLVRKKRSFYAPLLVSMGSPLMKILDTGVSVLRQRQWVEREMRLHRELYRTSIEVEDNGTLVLPCHPGETLADLLENPDLPDSIRRNAMSSAVVALRGLHILGFTHGDAMAENVLVDIESGTAKWFDFETLHDPRHSVAWRRADDLRALLATCAVRTSSDKLPETVSLIADAYADNDVTRELATGFSSLWQPRLVFHLGQAPLSRRRFEEIARLLEERALTNSAPGSTLSGGTNRGNRA